MRKIVLLFFVIGLHANLDAQIDNTSLTTIEGITNKMLALISGEIGEERNWDEFRNLFLPTAQLTALSETKSGKTRVSTMNIEEFVRNIGPVYARDGFEEYALGLTVNEFNGIANVFQPYYCKNLIGTYEKRGVNTYQLVYTDDRWWIASALFVDEFAETKLPDTLLFKKYQSGQEKK